MISKRVRIRVASLKKVHNMQMTATHIRNTGHHCKSQVLVLTYLSRYNPSACQLRRTLFPHNLSQHLLYTSLYCIHPCKCVLSHDHVDLTEGPRDKLLASHAHNVVPFSQLNQATCPVCPPLRPGCGHTRRKQRTSSEDLLRASAVEKC